MDKLTTFGILIILSVALIGCDVKDTSNSSVNHPTNTNLVSANLMNSNNLAAFNNSNRVAVVQENFWESAAQGGMAEVAIANLALSKSQTTKSENLRK